MADVDDYEHYDHRPRIVAVIPKKMHIERMDSTDSVDRAEQNQPKTPPTPPTRSVDNAKYGRLATVSEETTTMKTKDDDFVNNNRSRWSGSPNPTERVAAAVAEVESITTGGQRVGVGSANAAQQHHQRENNFNSLHQQKRVQPVEYHDVRHDERVEAGWTNAGHMEQDKHDGRVAQVRVSIQPIQPISTDADGNTRLSTLEENNRLAQLRKEYEFDKDRTDHHSLAGLLKDLGAAKRNMATLSPKSPKPAVSKTDKEESIWDKIGTLGRKKRIKEVQEVQEEGKHAIDSPGLPHFPTTSPEDYDLEENEERCMIDHGVYTNPLFIKLVNVLINWINDELASQRIIVQDLAEDLYDGQVLQKLLEKLTGDKLDVREVTQSEEGQKQKLHAVLSHFNHVLGLSRTGSKKWNVEAIHSKNIVSIMHLLVALARHFRPPVRLTEHVSVPVVIVKKLGGHLDHRTVTEVITTSYDDVGLRWERDAIDTLFDHAPEKLQMVKKSLVTFVNKHLTQINLEVTEIETQFHDGVYLTFLMGLLEGFFVPLHSFHSTPKDFEQKVHNVCFAFELMEEVGITKLKARPEDIVNQDLKSTLRVLYTLFNRYKHL